MVMAEVLMLIGYLFLIIAFKSKDYVISLFCCLMLIISGILIINQTIIGIINILFPFYIIFNGASELYKNYKKEGKNGKRKERKTNRKDTSS